jgi:hypothetical protein
MHSTRRVVFVTLLVAVFASLTIAGDRAHSSIRSDAQGQPHDFAIVGDYPNPFNPATAVQFSLAQPAEVNLVIYNVLGAAVVELHSGTLPAGQHMVRWDGRSDAGISAPTGVYFCRLMVEGRAETHKMLLLK